MRRSRSVTRRVARRTANTLKRRSKVSRKRRLRSSSRLRTAKRVAKRVSKRRSRTSRRKNRRVRKLYGGLPSGPIMQRQSSAELWARAQAEAEARARAATQAEAEAAANAAEQAEAEAAANAAEQTEAEAAQAEAEAVAAEEAAVRIAEEHAEGLAAQAAAAAEANEAEVQAQARGRGDDEWRALLHCIVHCDQKDTDIGQKVKELIDMYGQHRLEATNTLGKPEAVAADWVILRRSKVDMEHFLSYLGSEEMEKILNYTFNLEESLTTDEEIELIDRQVRCRPTKGYKERMSAFFESADSIYIYVKLQYIAGKYIEDITNETRRVSNLALWQESPVTRYLNPYFGSEDEEASHELYVHL